MRTSDLLGLGGLGALALKKLSEKRAKPTIPEGMQAGRNKRSMPNRERMPDMIGERNMSGPMMKKGGAVKSKSKSKSKSSASKRADGCAKKGRTRGKMI